MSNDAYDAIFEAHKNSPTSLSQARSNARQRNMPIPMNDQNVESCLCYHVFGFCWDNCTRKADHRAQTPTERDRLVEWCRRAF